MLRLGNFYLPLRIPRSFEPTSSVAAVSTVGAASAARDCLRVIMFSSLLDDCPDILHFKRAKIEVD